MNDSPQGIRPYVWHLMVRTFAEHMHMAHSQQITSPITWHDFESEAEEAIHAMLKVFAADDWPKSEKEN